MGELEQTMQDAGWAFDKEGARWVNADLQQQMDNRMVRAIFVRAGAGGLRDLLKHAAENVRRANAKLESG